MLLRPVLFATVKVLFVGVASIVVVEELFHFLFDVAMIKGKCLSARIIMILLFNNKNPINY